MFLSTYKHTPSSFLPTLPPLFLSSLPPFPPSSLLSLFLLFSTLPLFLYPLTYSFPVLYSPSCPLSSLLLSLSLSFPSLPFPLPLSPSSPFLPLLPFSLFSPLLLPDYKQDPYSEGNPMNTICSRGDLLETPVDGGCYDTKVHSNFTSG